MKSYKMIDVKLPKTLIKQVDEHALLSGLSTPEQIEKWIKLGMIAEEHPELTLSFVKELLQPHK